MTDPFAPPGGDPTPSTPPPTLPPNPWAVQPGWGQHPPYAPLPPTKPTSALAVVSLVAAILLLIPISLAFGIAAIVRMRRRDERGWGAVIAALAVCLGWSLLFALFVVVGVAGGWDAHSRGSLADVASSDVGSCVNEAPPEVTDCSTPHDLEVYFSPRLPDPAWPGTADLADDADRLCDEAFRGYVGSSPVTSDYDYDFFAPTRTEWEHGKHQVVCVVTPSGDELVGSVKGTQG